MHYNSTIILEAWEQGIAKNAMLRAGVSLLNELNKRFPNSQSLIVGGTVRCIIMGLPINDVDIATSIDINLIQKEFKTVDIGKSKSFNIVAVQYMGFVFEVAQFREDVY